VLSGLCTSEHDWFKVDLPEYLFPSASDVDASVVDTDAIREVCEVKLTRLSHRIVKAFVTS